MSPMCRPCARSPQLGSKLPEIGHAWPNLARIWAQGQALGTFWTSVGRLFPNFRSSPGSPGWFSGTRGKQPFSNSSGARVFAAQTSFDDRSDPVQPTLRPCAPHMPPSCRSGLSCPHAEPSIACYQTWANSAEIGPTLTTIGLTSAKFASDLAEISRSWPRLTRLRPNLAKIQAGTAQVWTSLHCAAMFTCSKLEVQCVKCRHTRISSDHHAHTFLGSPHPSTPCSDMQARVPHRSRPSCLQKPRRSCSFRNAQRDLLYGWSKMMPPGCLRR